MSARLLRLSVIATLAGGFSSLFGVGGGTIIVPLLIIWLGYGEREATGTSLAAIFVIAVLAALAHGAFGNVEVERGALIAAPAVAGVLAGTAIQQRASPRVLAAVFSLFLFSSAVALVL